MTVEPCWGKFSGFQACIEAICADVNFFDQGKQTKFVHLPEWFRPQKYPFGPAIREGGAEGVVEIGNNGGVPGVAGQGACVETLHVVGKSSNNHFEYLRG